MNARASATVPLVGTVVINGISGSVATDRTRSTSSAANARSTTGDRVSTGISGSPMRPSSLRSLLSCTQFDRRTRQVGGVMGGVRLTGGGEPVDPVLLEIIAG